MKFLIRMIGGIGPRVWMGLNESRGGKIKERGSSGGNVPPKFEQELMRDREDDI